MNNEGLNIVIISDSLGMTAETVLEACKLQFPKESVKSTEKHSFVTSVEEVKEILDGIELKNRDKTIILYTIVIPFVKDFLDSYSKEVKIKSLDLLTPCLDMMSATLKESPYCKSGMDARIGKKYQQRIEAMEFAVKYDDGKKIEEALDLCDLVIMGISRTGKTPLSIYLGTKNIKVCNIPISPDVKLPQKLFKIDKEKIVGLTIKEDKVASIRLQRLESLGLSDTNNYSNKVRIQKEIDYANKIFNKIDCLVIDVSDKAVEQTAMLIQSIKGGILK